jgi:UDP-N-acetylglucosamine 2-epimerase (non-hydrolysing)
MRSAQTIAEITTNVLNTLTPVLKQQRPDWVVVQGDTSSAFAAALAASYAQIRCAHVEAGLRTGDRRNPWPEEINRRMLSVLCDRHFAPTKAAQQNLINEGHDPASIVVTGNTVVDAIMMARNRLNRDTALLRRLRIKYHWLDPDRRAILVTAHRRESFGTPLVDICRAVRTLAERDDVQIVFPVHPNPKVRDVVLPRLTGLDNVRLIEPVSYGDMMYLLDNCDLVLTDSGGLQEEAPSFGKPVLVMRDATERNEAIDIGLARLVTTDTEAIVSAVAEILGDAAAYEAMIGKANPFGDGTAARQIVCDLLPGRGTDLVGAEPPALATNLASD